MQKSKTIYFPDYPSPGKSRCGLTVPFSEKNIDIFNNVNHLSSYSIRSKIGYTSFKDLEEAAEAYGFHPAEFVRLLLGNSLKNRNHKDESNFYKIQSTFKGGKGSPLHDWYPYLEGYSPDFVASVLDEFSPEAKNIFDPFCGSGTTALTAALRGGTGFYSEINPVCRKVISAKELALSLSKEAASIVHDQLNEIAAGIKEKLIQYEPNSKLLAAYRKAFTGKPFFSKSALNSILRAKSMSEDLLAHNEVVGCFFDIAVMRSLIPSSNLIRRGDLRFKTDKEIKKSKVIFEDELKRSLELISSDLLDIEKKKGDIEVLSYDAKKSFDSIKVKVDAVITSPPYLNGTNYFRNTKIELWYIGEIFTKSCLRSFRDIAITSGINDVTKNKIQKSKQVVSLKSDLLANTINQLVKNSYDMRIPAMVEGYFCDMATVFLSAKKILNKGGIVAIDLGDSAYGGVHVPTQEILSDILSNYGLIQFEKIVLRERLSRGGARLCQTLQVFQVN